MGQFEGDVPISDMYIILRLTRKALRAGRKASLQRRTGPSTRAPDPSPRWPLNDIALCQVAPSTAAYCRRHRIPPRCVPLYNAGQDVEPLEAQEAERLHQRRSGGNRQSGSLRGHSGFRKRPARRRCR